MEFLKLFLTKEHKVQTEDGNFTIEEKEDFIGKHTAHGKKSKISIRQPNAKELMIFNKKLTEKVNELSEEKRKSYLDNSFYRIDFDDFFFENAHKYIYLQDEETLLYSSKNELECEENSEMLSIYILNTIKNYFFFLSPALASWNAKKLEEEMRMKEMAIEMEERIRISTQKKLEE